jgi:anti-anti-sigma factor
VSDAIVVSIEDGLSPETVTKNRVGAMTHLFPRGNLTEPELLKALSAAVVESIDNQEVQLIIDMVSVSLVNSNALQTLFNLRQDLVRAGGWLKVTNAKPLIRDIFLVTGLDQVIDIVNSFNIDKTEVARPKTNSSEGIRMGDLLVNKGLLTKEKVEEAIQLQRKSGKRIGQIIVSKGWVSEDVLLTALGEQLGIPHIVMRQGLVDQDVFTQLDFEVSQRLKVVPMFLVHGELTLATSDPQAIASFSEIETILQEYLSEYGNIKALPDNDMLVIEDLPSFLNKMETLLGEIDREPKQIMIEAKILEITLTDNQSYGLDWAKLFDSSDGTGSLGTQGLANPNSAGLFAQYTNSNVELVLNALKARGRLRTISTPKLLAMEGLEAETVVGTEIGYRVTTTINNVTTESIEFLESGVILKVTPTVDRSGRIMLDIFPEVSTGVVSDDGIPSKATTQVSTRMLVSDGKTVFLGGLIQNQINNTREGIPGLGDVPIIGGLFSNRSKSIVSTEIVVLITPRIVDYTSDEPQVPAIERVEVINEIIDAELLDTEKDLEKAFDGNSSPGASDDLGDRSK